LSDVSARAKSAWIPANNGKVIKILAINNSIADLDSNGDIGDQHSLDVRAGLMPRDAQLFGHISGLDPQILEDLSIAREGVPEA